MLCKAFIEISDFAKFHTGTAVASLVTVGIIAAGIRIITGNLEELKCFIVIRIEVLILETLQHSGEIFLEIIVKFMLSKSTCVLSEKIL